MSLDNTPIYINGRFLSQPLSGVQRVSYEFLRALDTLLAQGLSPIKNVRASLLIPPDADHIPKFEFISTKQVGRLKGQLWEQFDLPIHSRDGWLISLGNTSTLFKINQSVMIHDAAVYSAPHGFTWKFRLWYKFLFFIIGKTAKSILTVSNFSKQELIRKANLSPEKITVIPNGVDHFSKISPDFSILDTHNLRNSNFILVVGSANPNKNIDSVFSALSILEDSMFNVVIVGGNNQKVFGDNHQQRIFSNNIRSIYTGHITDNQLKALYSSAKCFVFPSLYEGFGIPPLEAMSCECTVLASHSSSIPEVCGDAAIYFDPLDTAELSALIGNIMSTESVLTEYKEKGKLRSRLFNWQDSANKLLETVAKYKESP